MACDAWISIKILLFLLSIVCMILKKATDYDASRLFFLLEKLSYEWPLLTNVTWDEHGAAFVDITFGGFIIITAGLVVAAAAGQLRSSNAMETFFLFLGTLMFGAAGALILASIDQIPEQLIDNAAALGVIALLTALLFLADLLLSSRRRRASKRPLPPRSVPATTQTHHDPTHLSHHQQYPPAHTHHARPAYNPMFASLSEPRPLYRMSEHQTRPKWLQVDESDGESVAPPPGWGSSGAAAPPPRGYVMRQAHHWEQTEPPVRKGRAGERDTMDVELEFSPHTNIEVSTEGPKAQVLNTKVLHKWLQRQRADQTRI